MKETIDMVADDPSDAPVFGATPTRLLSENELSGLLAEDARNAPAAIAHPKVVRRATQPEMPAVPAQEAQPGEPDPWQAAPADRVPAPPPVAGREGTRVRLLLVALLVIAAAAAAGMWLASGLR